ncbi:vomeronasal type-1 receptor 1-like [Sarcophilus harrisii]
MNPKDIILGTVFCAQTAFGVLGNSFLICLFLCTFLTGRKMRPIDTILVQLACFNSLLLLSKGIPQTMTALGWKNFLDDKGCIIFFYFHKVSRGLSLSITSLLSGFQAITISPSNSSWAEIKVRAPKYIISTSFFCCIIHLLFNSIVFVKFKSLQGYRNYSELHSYGYCPGLEATKVGDAFFGIVASLRDAAFLGLMVLASGYMIFFLYGHHKRNQYLYTVRLSPRASPKTKAISSILLLGFRGADWKPPFPTSTFLHSSVPAVIFSCPIRTCWYNS